MALIDYFGIVLVTSSAWYDGVLTLDTCQPRHAVAQAKDWWKKPHRL